MKTFGRNFLPELNFNPIIRDLFLVVAASLIVAVILVSFGVMIVSSWR